MRVDNVNMRACVLLASHCIIYTDCQFYSGDLLDVHAFVYVLLFVPFVSLCLKTAACATKLRTPFLVVTVEILTTSPHRQGYGARALFFSLSLFLPRSFARSFVHRVFFLRSACAVPRSTLGSVFDAQCYTYAPGG